MFELDKKPNHNDQDFIEEFPERWLCPFCLAMQEMNHIQREDILTHVSSVHSDVVETNGLTWETFYIRMCQVGGV